MVIHKNILLYSKSVVQLWILPTLSLVNCATASNSYDEFCYCNTCSENEGDCDTHDECQDGLICGSNNCPASLGFDFEVDCCYPNENPCYDTCGYPNYKGDNYCDDENNNCGCEWDGGDCCGDNLNTQYCTACECLDPNAKENGNLYLEFRYQIIL